jgi:hypothetical protein
VVLYKVKIDDFAKVSSREIAEWKWFNIDNLPKGTSAATAKRIQEYMNNSYTNCW